MSKNCEKCRSVIPEGYAFCPNCGTPINAQMLKEGDTIQSKRTGDKRNKEVLLTIFSLIVTVFLVALAFYEYKELNVKKIEIEQANAEIQRLTEDSTLQKQRIEEIEKKLSSKENELRSVTSKVEGLEKERIEQEAYINDLETAVLRLADKAGMLGSELDTNGPITEGQFEQFYATSKGSPLGRADEYQKVLNFDFSGTWYDAERGVAIRITKDGAYYYYPALQYFGDELYEWELIDRTERGKSPQLTIYINGKGTGGITYYISGVEHDYFWSNSQSEVFYRQK